MNKRPYFVKLPVMHPFQLQHHWFNDMLTWIAFQSPHGKEYKAAGFSIPDDRFLPWLDEFMQSSLGKSHERNLVRCFGRICTRDSGQGPVFASRARAFSVGDSARVSSVVAVAHRIERVLGGSWLDIQAKLGPVQDLDVLFSKLPGLVLPVAAAAAAGSLGVLVMFLAARAAGVVSGGTGGGAAAATDTTATAAATAVGGGRRGHAAGSMTLEAIGGAAVAIASAAATLRWIMGAARFELHPFSFIYTVVVVVLTTVGPDG